MNEGVSSSKSNSGDKSNDVGVKSGAWKKSYAPGQTVREYRKQLGEYHPIPDGAVAYSGTTPLSDDDVLEAGMSIEFIKKTGEKG